MAFYIDRIPDWMHATAAMVVVAAALWRGGREERACALVVAFQAINGNVAPWSTGPPTDLASLAIFLWFVLRSARYWTVWAAASAVLSLTTHLLNVVLDLDLWAYLSAQIAWYYVLIGAVLVGSLQRRPPAAGTSAHVH